MASGATGDFAKMAKMQADIKRMIGVPERAAKSAAPILQGMIRSEFVTKTDSFGDPWEDIKPITYRKGTKSILVRSGTMWRQIGADPVGSRVKIVLGTEYARYFISTKWSILPRGGSARPESWARLFRDETEKAFRAFAEGR